MTVLEHEIAAERVLMLRYLNRAVDLCQQGYPTGSDVDTAMRLDGGPSAGRLAMLDDLGPGRALKLMADGGVNPAPVMTTLVATGRPGRKTGGGIRVARQNKGASR
ncbi:3-hydroxyacyl-CoA dehydrogenase family protein [Micromonospora eburnea]|uniref:3-hydroxyacyl-CoA dehydrogenase, C-terminal domain n=1 Tax=Micromonospora eburnea TaxID=227316 RepID=A0A1C6UZC4_9ACTN|nr:3-hydroxyacyl-CoA dehydrogenase family protein [Micromonospora eburnea]SCL59362.1 3-hydroxyacyl-CoA dehydrogenase, C-terminal domain [Micromonospora eburnea]